MPNGYYPSALKSVIDEVYDDLYDLEAMDPGEYPSAADALIDEMLKPEYRQRIEEERGS